MADGLDVAWTLLAGVLVFYMQAGFAMLEAGSVRAKNSQHMIMKNVIDASMGAIGWWCIGYGIAFGASNADSAIGTDMFFVTDHTLKNVEGSQDMSFHIWFFQYTFCATAGTIVSGAMAERTELLVYLFFALLMSTFIYPMIVHWTWGGGWLAQDGYTDFAGSGVVHLVGGAAALAGAVVVGPRAGRFDPSVDQSEFDPSSRSQICLGTLILWFGWYGFNAGSTTQMTDGAAEVAARCCVTTTIAAAAGGITSFLVSSYMSKQYDMVAYANGVLGGLVGITAGCSNMDTHTAFIIGIVSGFIYVGSSKLLEKLKVDDPIGAFPVHGACGIWGLVATGLWDMDKGWWYGNEFEKCIGPNLLGVLVIVCWTVGMSLPFFLTMKFFNLLRVKPEVEEMGMDQEIISASKGSPKSTVGSKSAYDDAVKAEKIVTGVASPQVMSPIASGNVV